MQMLYICYLWGVYMCINYISRFHKHFTHDFEARGGLMDGGRGIGGAGLPWRRHPSTASKSRMCKVLLYKK